MDILCIVDIASREVSFPEKYVIAAYDHNADVVHFDVEPIEGFALDTASIRIAAQGPNGVRHDYEIDAGTVTIEEGTGNISFDWAIPQGVTEMPLDTFKYGSTGTLIFAVCAEIVSGTTLSKAWHSDDGVLTVVAHLEPENGGEDPSEEATNAQKIGQLQTDVAVVQRAVAAVAGGTPTVVDAKADMTDTNKIYVLSTDGKWYYHDGTTWTAGGTYGGAVTSTTFDKPGVPADDFAVGQALAEKADADDVDAIKAIISGLVVNESALSEFIDNTDIDYAFDETTNANYTVIRIYKHKIDGTEQYPFVYAPNGAGSGDKSTIELMENEAWLLAINAGVFDTTHCTPDGMTIQNGSVVKNAVSATHPQCKPLTIDTDGNLGYAAYNADASTLVSQGIVSAVCGFMPIIIDYDPVPSSEWNAVSHYTENAQRQIIGQFGNGDYAIVTCEGRNFNNSDGWTIAEAQTICQKIGLKFAYNLDGGGSTETLIGKYPVNTVYEGTKGRKVPTFIVFNGKDTFSIPSIVRVSGITLLSHSGTVKEGEGLTVEAVVTPSNATDKSIIWTSSDPAVAVVSDGRISGVSEGTATITATTSDGGYTDTFAVTVKSAIVLPTGYKRVQYVQANGNQYINTGIAETANLGAEYTYSIDADSTYGTGNHVLSSGGYFYPFLRSTSDTTDRSLLVTQRGQAGGQEYSCPWTLDTVYSIKAFVGNNDFFVGGTKIGTLATGSSLSASNNLYLFAYGGSPTNAVYRFKGKLYGMTLYNAGGTVVHRYVPCKNPSDVAGLYDVVAGQFLHSDSGTELIAGAEIDTDTDDDTPTPESNVFLVTVTVTSETTGTADKTFAEVLEAWDAGKVVRGYAPAIGMEVDFTIHSSTTEDGEAFAALVPSGTGLKSITLYDGGDGNPANVAIMTYGG